MTELYGKVRVVTNDYTVHTYATGLLNYDPTGPFPGSGEQGLTGLAIDPSERRPVRQHALRRQPARTTVANRFPKVDRGLHSTDGGLTAAHAGRTS